MWKLLRSRGRPSRLSDEVHSTWEIQASTLEGYPDLVRIVVEYAEEREVALVVNRSGLVVSQRVTELD